MTNRALCTMLMVIFVTGSAAWAQQPAENVAQTARLAGQIAPFLNNQTAILVHVNLDQIDSDAAATFVSDALTKTTFPPDDIRALVEQFRGTKAMVQQLRTLGLHHAYLVLGLEIPMLNQPPIVTIIPLAADADEAALRKMLSNLLGPAKALDIVPQKINDALVLGTPQALSDAQALVSRSEAKLDAATAMLKAMDIVGRHAVDIVIMPTPDMRRVVAELMPKLPPELGGGDSAVLAQGVRYIGVTLKLPPEPMLKIQVQADSAPRAAQLAEIWGHVEKLLAAQTANAPPEILPVAQSALAALRPKVEEDRLTTTLDSAGVGQFAQLLMPAAGRAKEAANRARSASQAKQLIVACVLYAADHQGQWPDALDAAMLIKYGITEDRLQSPRHPDRKPGYIYLKPKVGNKATPDTIVMYENTLANDDGLIVGFADGHVEWLRSPNFQQSLEKQNAETLPAK